MSSFKNLVRILNGTTNWSWKSLFSGSGTIRILERLNRFWVKNPAGSWCNLVSNLVRIQGTSPLQASSRISGLPNQDPDPHWVESRVTSEETLVSNPGRIQETSPLQDSTRNSAFPEEKRAFPCRILFRSVTELERKSQGSPLGLEEKWVFEELHQHVHSLFATEIFFRKVPIDCELRSDLLFRPDGSLSNVWKF